MNTRDPYEKIREMGIENIEIGRDMLLTDAHDLAEGQPDLLGYARSLEKETYDLGTLLNELEKSEFFQQLTASMQPLARIQKAEEIRAFLQDCSEMIVRQALYPESSPDGNVRRAIQDHIQEMIHGRILRLIGERAEHTPPPTTLETQISLSIFMARMSQTLLTRIRKNEELLADESDPGNVETLTASLTKNREDHGAIMGALKAIREGHEGRLISAALVMEKVAAILRSNESLRTDEQLRLLSRCIGEALGDDATRNVPGFQRGIRNESIILLREYQTQYAVAARNLIGLGPTDDD